MAKEEVVRIRGDFRSRCATRYFYGRLFLQHLTFRKFMNFLAVEQDIRFHALHPSSRPYILKVETTNICTNKCIFCFDGRRPPKEGERGWGTMSLETFEEIISKFRDTTLIAFLYGFGEPLLDPTIGEKIAVCRRAGVTSLISTDLLPPDKSIIGNVIDAGIDAIRISSHGASRKTYKKYTRTDRYDEVMANLKYLMDYRKKSGGGYPLVEWKFCFNNFNLKEIESARHMASELGIDYFRVTPMWVPPQVAEEWMPVEVIKEFSRKAASLTCNLHYRQLMINWDGTLRPCCRNERLLRNDVGHYSAFDEIWNGEVYEYIRNLTAGRGPVNLDMHVPCNTCEIVTGRKVMEEW